MHLSALRELDIEELTKLAEEAQIENAAGLKKHELIFALLTKKAKDNEEIFKHQADLKGIRTALLFTDGLMGETDAFLRKVVNTFGNALNVIGGGAGFMTLTQQPCIFTNEGIFQDGGVFVM